jgi:hypothetical protein
VSIDAADPPETWRWAGPTWTGRAPRTTGASIASITVTAEDPMSTANTWAAVLGLEAEAPGAEAEAEGETMLLLDGAQSVRFAEGGAGITEISVGGGGNGSGSGGETLQIGRAVIRNLG